MDLISLADEIASVRQRIANAVAGVSLDAYQQNAFAFISNRLEEMETECRTGSLKPTDKRYPELSRITVEFDPSVLSPDLGGEMIAIEKKYQKA